MAHKKPERNLLKLACFLTWLCTLPLFSHAQNFADGVWLKYRVKENGIFHITYNDLKNAGINPDNIKPSQIHLLSYPTGMLPQANNITRPADNLEVAITITGEADGKFDKSDEIIFYGQGPDQYRYINSKNSFYYENNIYTDYNYYFLRIADVNGNRISKSNVGSGSHTVIDQYVDFGYYESELYNDQKSGRDWFGEQFETKKDITIRFAMPGIVPNSNITFVSNLMAQSYEYSTFKILWNTVPVLERQMDTIPQTQYGAKGTYGIDTIQLVSNNVKRSEQHQPGHQHQVPTRRRQSIRRLSQLHFVYRQPKDREIRRHYVLSRSLQRRYTFRYLRCFIPIRWNYLGRHRSFQCKRDAGSKLWRRCEVCFHQRLEQVVRCLRKIRYENS
ncbi:MAG: hypothetical protein WDO15_15860 [Bacteroidota bacterium]